MTIRQLLTWVVVIAVCFMVYAAIEFIIIKYNGTYIPAPTIPRSPLEMGNGSKLTYVVMGDSTSIGQGTAYEHSYAMASAKHLSEKHTVNLINTGVSGAKVSDVLHDQLAKAVRYKPELVLLGVGANDTTHFTNLNEIELNLQKIIDGLKQANPDVRIVATRSPALDSVSRFPIISKFMLGIRTHRVNAIFDAIIEKNKLTPALIAEKTREAFLKDSTLTAADNFHPNTRGYALWIPIINEALDQALKND